MKKIFAVVLVFMLVLCGCGTQTQDDISSVFTSSLPQSEHKHNLEKYVGKEDYTYVSLGNVNFAQNEDNYYYIDFYQAYSVNKKTKEKTALFDTTISLSMFHYQGYMIFKGSGSNIFLYNLKTKQKTEKTYPEEWDKEFHFEPNFYMVKDGFVMVGFSPDEEKEMVYYVDSEIKNRKLLNTESCYTVLFVLDDDVFYLGEDSNIYCCNIKTNKNYYVTNYKATPRDYENPDKRLSSEILQYLGKGKILIYGDEKLQILNLSDGSSFRPYTEKQEKNMEEISAIYDDDAIYFMIWESAIEYRVDALSYETLTPKTIYRGVQTEKEEDLWHEVELVSCDKEYLYFEDLYSLGKENYFRIKKDGSGKEILFYYDPLNNNDAD